MNIGSKYGRWFVRALLIAWLCFGVALLFQPQPSHAVSNDTDTTLLRHCRVSVLISSADAPHLKAVLKELAEVAKHKDVSVEQVAIVGLQHLQKIRGSGLSRSVVSRPGHAILGSLFQHLETIDISYPQFARLDDFISAHQLQYSPVWIIELQGKRYLIEGRISITRWLNTRLSEMERNE